MTITLLLYKKKKKKIIGLRSFFVPLQDKRKHHECKEGIIHKPRNHSLCS